MAVVSRAVNNFPADDCFVEIEAIDIEFMPQAHSRQRNAEVDGERTSSITRAPACHIHLFI